MGFSVSSKTMEKPAICTFTNLLEQGLLSICRSTNTSMALGVKPEYVRVVWSSDGKRDLERLSGNH